MTLSLKLIRRFTKGLLIIWTSPIKNMSLSTNSQWGDEVTLRVAADVYQVKIILITSIKLIPFMEFLPKSQKEPDKVIHMSYLAGIHFNSIYKKNKEKG